MDGITRLRGKRGDQKVTFADVTDHLADWVERHPEDAAVIDRVAAFMAGVEDDPHEHETGGAGSTAEP